VCAKNKLQETEKYSNNYNNNNNILYIIKYLFNMNIKNTFSNRLRN